MAEAVDILIAGGGPVGAALALALQDSGHSVVLAEARTAESGDARIAHDARAQSAKPAGVRAIALSYSSRLILQRLNAWSGLAATPIETIHISQQGCYGRTLIRAAECGVPALGYVVTYDNLQQTMLEVPCSGKRIFGAKVTGFDGTTVLVQTPDGELAFTPQLTVFADGASIADGRPAPAYSKDYRQSAVTALVTTEQAHRSRAWERFTPEGPLALLPFGTQYGLVWTASPERAMQLCALDTPSFLGELQAAFGDRLGAFIEAGNRGRFPLALRYRKDEAQPRSLSVGNAAQTLHPVAGQGFNLGLRDAWELARLARDEREPGSADFCARYRRTRSSDRRAGIQFTDSLVGLFSNANPLLQFGRGAGLLALDLIPFARRFVARRMIYGARALP
jgi:2-octaprenyl-6-methoxyphenol hydroxylase